MAHCRSECEKQEQMRQSMCYHLRWSSILRPTGFQLRVQTTRCRAGLLEMRSAIVAPITTIKSKQTKQSEQCGIKILDLTSVPHSVPNMQDFLATQKQSKCMQLPWQRYLQTRTTTIQVVKSGLGPIKFTNLGIQYIFEFLARHKRNEHYGASEHLLMFINPSSFCAWTR